MPSILGGGREVEEVTLDGALDGARSGLDRHKVADSIYQQMQEERLDFGIAPDGLPRPIVKGNLPLAPVLDTKTFVCMADTSKFVIRDRWGDVVLTVSPSLVSRTEGGAYRCKTAELAADACSDPIVGIGDNNPHGNMRVSKLLSALRDEGCDLGADSRTYIKVEPIRPQCRHYARQMTDFADNAEARFVERVCTARRDSGGEFLSLRDSCMYACELRTPRDAVSEKTLDDFDAEKVRLGRERTQSEEPFDVDAALASIGKDLELDYDV